MRIPRRTIAVALGAVLLAPAAAVAEETARAETTVEVTKDGRIPLDLEVDALHFQELLVQKVSTDPAVTAARPPDEPVVPQVVAVGSNLGEDELELRLLVTFLDDAGAEVLTCRSSDDQDQQTLAETHEICSGARTKMARWAKVKQVRFQVRVVEDD